MSKKNPERKFNVLKNLITNMDKFDQILICNLDNISNNQIHKVRLTLRKTDSVMIVAKNSIIRKAIQLMANPLPANAPKVEKELMAGINKKPNLKAMLPQLVKNFALIFSNVSYVDLKDEVEKEVVMQPAKSGVIAPCDVYLPEGPTNMDPSKIEIFHTLNIPTKIAKQTIEITKAIKVITEGEVVLESAASMCKLLNIIPFGYSIRLRNVYDNGKMLNKEVINTKPEDVLNAFKLFANNVTALSLGAGLPNALSVPHMINNGFKSLMAIGVESDYKFKELEAALNAKPVTSNAPATNKKVEEKKEEKVEEEEEVDMNLDDMFG